jgi:hypothetical protein
MTNYQSFFFFTKCKKCDYHASSSSSQCAIIKSNNFQKKEKKAYDLPTPKMRMMTMANHPPSFIWYFSSMLCLFSSEQLAKSFSMTQKGDEFGIIRS